MLLITALGTLALFLVLRLDFSVVAVVIFLAVFSGIYFSQSVERRMLRTSFWFLPIFSIVGIKLLSPSLLLSSLSLLPFAVLFFVLLGLMNLVFRDRFLVYGIFNTALLLLIFLIAFYAWRPGSFLILGPVLFLVVALLFMEVLGVFEIFLGRRALVVGGTLGLLAAEVVWLTGFLPLGFINAAVFATLFFLLLRDGLAVHFRGFLNLPFIFRQLTFFIVLTIVIFAASSWSV